jgi:hypothetical protein
LKLVVVALLAMGLGAQALSGQSATTFSVGGGLALPAGEFNTYADNGWSINGAVEHRLGSHPTALRLGVSYTVNADNTAIGFHETTRLTGAFASFVYHFVGARPHIYGLIGLGAFHRDFSTTDTEDPGLRDTRFAMQLGEGVQFSIRSVRLFVEGRFITTLGQSPFQYFPIIAGVRLGGPRV